MSAPSTMSTEKDLHHKRIAILVCRGSEGTRWQAILTLDYFKQLQQITGFQSQR